MYNTYMFEKNIFKSFVKKELNRKEAENQDRDFKFIQENTEKEIFDFQKEKEKLVEKMHELLKIADEGGEIFFDEKNLISVGFDGENYQTFGKKSGKISKGDIAVASLWGKNLKLNAEIDRKTKKEFIIRETKRKIKELWERQLILAGKDSPEIKKLSYDILGKNIDIEKDGKIEELQPGHLAEKVVESFFTRLVEENPELPFEFEVADVYDDIEYKADFYLHIKKEFKRAVNVDVCEDCEKENIGVQYTMNRFAEKKKLWQIKNSKKKNQEKIFDDLVLVSVPLNSLSEALKKWQENKKDRTNFSGPEKFLDEDELKKIFIKMTENLPSYLEINPKELWKKNWQKITSHLLTCYPQKKVIKFDFFLFFV